MFSFIQLKKKFKFLTGDLRLRLRRFVHNHADFFSECQLNTILFTKQLGIKTEPPGTRFDA